VLRRDSVGARLEVSATGSNTTGMLIDELLSWVDKMAMTWEWPRRHGATGPVA
jgi:hypothetical protein